MDARQCLARPISRRGASESWPGTSRDQQRMATVWRILEAIERVDCRTEHIDEMASMNEQMVQKAMIRNFVGHGAQRLSASKMGALRLYRHMNNMRNTVAPAWDRQRMAARVVNFHELSRNEKEIICLEAHAPQDSKGSNRLLIFRTFFLS